MDLKDIFQDNYLNKEVTLKGWIKNHRRQKEFGFIDFSDGTCFKSIQLVYDNSLPNFEEISHLLVGSAIKIQGTVIESQGNQDIEIKITSLEVLVKSSEDNPIQPKRHTREFLREVSYLRPRTNLFNAVFRVRSTVAGAIHKYFQEKGYVYVHSPILTANDGEGAGEMFKVTTFDLANVPKTEEGNIDYKQDFFGQKVGLTVTGQLQAEAYALAYKKVYTFGPTFRAEVSHTKNHASEFWMIEPEIAFCDLEGLMDIEEDLLKYLIKYTLQNCPEEMELFNKFVESGIIERLKKVLDTKAVRITHAEAIKILKGSGQKFEFEPKDGEDIATEHEKYLTEEYFKAPVFVKDWPKEIKAFYMRLNDDQKTVAAVDLLVPGSGELMGGSQREERLDVLQKKMQELGVPEKGLEWYLNLRRFGGGLSSGFGMGFERLIIYLTGVDNIRDVIPFPRTPNSCDF